VNPNVFRLRRHLDLELRRWPSAKTDISVETMRLRRSCTDECERDCVRSRIAAFQMRRGVFAVCDHAVMLVSGEAVVVLGVIVVVVGVGVQQGHRARCGDQHQNEQQRHRAVHNMSLWDEDNRRQKRQTSSRRGTAVIAQGARRNLALGRRTSSLEL
jgi:hypothetical protein